MYPQTLYNGPPPNYVELELQIVPFLAASLYKIFGVHEIFGRILTIAFSLATVVTLAYFARWLFRSALAGLVAAFFYAVFPGSVYYGRTFMPDCAMVFFLTAALYAVTRYLVEDEDFTLARLSRKHRASHACLSREAGCDVGRGAVARACRRRKRAARPMRPLSVAVLLAVPLLVLGSTIDASTRTRSGIGPAASRDCTCSRHCATL